MAEKRRGLGRGLGSLIPSQEPGRPSDVFFPRGERSDDAVAEPSEESVKERRSSDPAESMRRAQAGRRTAAANRPGTRATPAKSAAAKTTENTPSAEAEAPPKKASATKRAVSGASANTKSPTRSSAGSATKSTEGTRSKATPKAKQSQAAESTRGSATDNDTSIIESNEYGETESSVDGVYISRERAHTLAASLDDTSELDESLETAGEAEADIDASVSRETDDDSDEPFEGLVPVPGTTFGEIDLDLIRPNPRQPRDVFDEDALDELITSIREIGVLQPVVVRRRPEMPGHYELIMGERRFRASREAGRTKIPAIVRATADDDLLRDALLENLHRVDLNPLEEAAAYSQLLDDFNCTQEELSARIGRSRPQISNTIRLLKLPAMVQRRVAAGVLSSGHARALLGITDGANMEVLAQRVVAEGLSVRATEESVVLLNRGDRITVSRGTREASPEFAELARSLGDRLDTRVNLVMGKRKGKLSVEFANPEDLSRILLLLGLDASEQDD